MTDKEVTLYRLAVVAHTDRHAHDPIVMFTAPTSVPLEQQHRRMDWLRENAAEQIARDGHIHVSPFDLWWVNQTVRRGVLEPVTLIVFRLSVTEEQYETLSGAGVGWCAAEPPTREMHFQYEFARSAFGINYDNRIVAPPPKDWYKTYSMVEVAINDDDLSEMHIVNVESVSHLHGAPAPTEGRLGEWDSWDRRKPSSNGFVTGWVYGPVVESAPPRAFVVGRLTRFPLSPETMKKVKLWEGGRRGYGENVLNVVRDYLNFGKTYQWAGIEP